MKKLLILLALLLASTTPVYATDVVIAATTISDTTGFNPASLPANRSITVTATGSSTTVTSSAAFPPQIVGVGGFQVLIDGSQYVVASVTSTSSLTLTTAFSGSTGSYTMTLYRYVLLQIYADRPFQPLGESYIVQPSTPGAQSWYKRVACSIINNGSTNILYIPQITVDATTDAVGPTNQARYTAGFYRPDGSLIQFYACFEQFRVPDTTPTTWVALCAYNSPPAVLSPNNESYTKPQIDARLPSCTSGQMVYYAATGNELDCLTVGSGLTISGGTISASGGGGGAPTDATYVTMSLNSTLTAERVLTGTANQITVTDGGANGNATLSIASAFNITGITSTAPIKSGTSPPGTCSVGEYFYDSDATAGLNTFACTASNTWTLQGDGGGAPAGSNTQVQYNNSGAFGASANFTWTNASARLQLGVASSATGVLRFAASGDGNVTSIQSGDSPNSDVLIKLPADDPAAGELLTVTSFSGGTAVLEWAAASGSGTVGSGLQYEMAYYPSNGTTVDGNSGITTDARNDFNVAPTAATSGSPTLITLTGPAHTTLTADTEAADVDFNLNRTVQWAAGGGSFATQRAIRLQMPTYAANGAETITTAIGLDLNTPSAGTNMTLTNVYAQRIAPSAVAHHGLLINVPSSATGDLIRLQNNSTSNVRFVAKNDTINVVVAANGALSTSATDGFLYIGSSAGTPVGTPTTYTGAVPIEIDTTNSRLYGYFGGSWVNLTGSGGGGCPAGTSGQVQYYSGGSCGGAAGFIYQSGASPNVAITAQNATYTALALYAAGSPSASVLTVRAQASGTDFEILSTGRPTTSSRNGAGTTSELYGAGSAAAGNNTVAFGYSASAAGTESSAVGKSATSSGQNAVAIGYDAQATDINTVALGASTRAAEEAAVAIGTGADVQSTATGSLGIGAYARITGDNSILFNTSTTYVQVDGNSSIVFNQSAGSTVSQSNHFIAGDDDYPITDVYFGRGAYSSSSADYTIHGTNVSGANATGHNLNIGTGTGTGSGIGGVVNIQGSRGDLGGGFPSTNNTLTTIFSFGTAAGASLAYQTAQRGATTVIGTLTENLSLSTGGATTDTSIQIPANSFILSVTVRITTTIAGVDSTTLSVGDSTTAARFGTTGTLTSGTTVVGLSQLQGSISTDATGPVTTSAIAVRLTLSGGADNTPSAGAVTVTAHYIQLTAPTS